MSKIIKGPEQAVEHAKCQHEWGKWRDGAKVKGKPSFVRYCDLCRTRETTFVEPGFVKRV